MKEVEESIKKFYELGFKLIAINDCIMTQEMREMIRSYNGAYLNIVFFSLENENVFSDWIPSEIILFIQQHGITKSNIAESIHDFDSPFVVIEPLSVDKLKAVLAENRCPN